MGHLDGSSLFCSNLIETNTQLSQLCRSMVELEESHELKESPADSCPATEMGTGRHSWLLCRSLLGQDHVDAFIPATVPLKWCSPHRPDNHLAVDIMVLTILIWSWHLYLGYILWNRWCLSKGPIWKWCGPSCPEDTNGWNSPSDNTRLYWSLTSSFWGYATILAFCFLPCYTLVLPSTRQRFSALFPTQIFLLYKQNGTQNKNVRG